MTAPIRFALAHRLAAAAIFALPAQAYAATSLLPAGYLTTSGSQVTDLAAHNVRLACVGYPEPGTDIAADMSGMVAYGFNCLRYPWYDATLAANLAQADQIVAAASAVGLKVILDHHGDETPSASNNYLPYPCNGLPFDKGPGTNGTDGCGDTGTVTRQRYVRDWVTVAKHFAGNATVIGFDLTNEPHLNPGWYAQNPGGATWGTGKPTDLRAIYAEAGNAIQAADPGVLVIAEGIENFTHRLFDGGKNTIVGSPDLTLAASEPVALTLPQQLVYSVHDYPTSISGTKPDHGTAKITAMNTGWGYLVTGNIAPVWIGEMGASLDGKGPDSAGKGALANERKWAATMVAYVNGQDGAQGGPTFSGCQQGIGTDWWLWGNLDGQSPDGTLGDNGKPRRQQQAVTQQLTFVPINGC